MQHEVCGRFIGAVWSWQSFDALYPCIDCKSAGQICLCAQGCFFELCCDKRYNEWHSNWALELCSDKWYNEWYFDGALELCCDQWYKEWYFDWALELGCDQWYNEWHSNRRLEQFLHNICLWRNHASNIVSHEGSVDY